MLKFIQKILCQLGTVGERLKYGFEKSAQGVEVTMAASQALAAASGRFITLDGSGNGALTDASDTTIYGHVDGGYGYTTSVNDVLMCNCSPDSVFRIPVISGTASRADVGCKRDLVISGGVQGLAADVSTRGHVIVVAVDETNQAWADVKMNPAIMGK